MPPPAAAGGAAGTLGRVRSGPPPAEQPAEEASAGIRTGNRPTRIAAFPRPPPPPPPARPRPSLANGVRVGEPQRVRFVDGAEGVGVGLELLDLDRGRGGTVAAHRGEAEGGPGPDQRVGTGHGGGYSGY